MLTRILEDLDDSILYFLGTDSHGGPPFSLLCRGRRKGAAWRVATRIAIVDRLGLINHKVMEFKGG